jgi:hypothetical protein
MPRSTKTKTISLDKEVRKQGLKMARLRGFQNSFSAYVSKLILDDARAIRNEEAQAGKVVPA